MDIINIAANVLLVFFAVSAGSILKPALGTSLPVKPPTVGNTNSQPGLGNSNQAGCTSDQPLLSSFPVCGIRKLKPLYQWRVLTYATPPGFQADPSYDPTDAYITGITAFGSNLYLSTPSTNSIVPSTLNTVPKTASSSSSPPALQPYPDMSWNEYDRDFPDCNSSLIAVHRTYKDNCNRLWALDSGQLYTSEFEYENICPPKIVIFDMITNKMVKLVTIPSSVLQPSSRLLNIVLDNETTSSRTGTSGTTANPTNSQCDVKFVYIADTSESALIVYNVQNDSFYNISHPFMYPDPNVPYFTADGINFTSFYGILGMDLAGSGNNRYLYFSAFSSNNTFKIPTSFLQQVPNYKDRSEIPVTRAFKRLGPGIAFLTDRSTGCLLYNPIDQGTMVGWNPALQSQNVLATNRTLLTLGLDMTQDFSYQITYLAQSRIPQYRKKNRSDVNNVSILTLTQTG